jgi:hypothetical protein
MRQSTAISELTVNALMDVVQTGPNEKSQDIYECLITMDEGTERSGTALF